MNYNPRLLIYKKTIDRKVNKAIRFNQKVIRE